MEAKFTKFDTNSQWVEGNIGEYNFEAKLFDEGSQYGIDNGRVSKLSIWSEKIRQEKNNFFSDCIVNYDRGWDIEPKNQYIEHFNAVMELLENAPKRF